MTTLQQLAYNEAKQYGLTPEEAETMTATQIMKWKADHEPSPLFDGTPLEVKPDLITQDLQKVEIQIRLKQAKDKEALRTIWNDNPKLQNIEWFIDACREQKKVLQDRGVIDKPPLTDDYRHFSNPQPEEVPYINNNEQPF